MRTEYKIDPRLLSWIKKNMGGCPQVPDDLRKITKLDSDKVNRSSSTEGYITPKWLVEERGDFSLLGELPNLEYLRINRFDLGDWSFLPRCKKLRTLIVQNTDFTDCRLLAELPLLESVSLPAKSKLKHREVLDTIKAKATAANIEEKQPFYRDEDYQDMEIVLGEEIPVPGWEGGSGVRCVSVQFCGKTPAGWKAFPHGEYQEDNWLQLSQEDKERLAEELAEAIRKENVEGLSLSVEPWGEENFLCGEFAPGWAALWYDDMENGIAYTIHNTDYDTVEDLCPIEIGGQSPVPKMWALEDMEEAARIVRCYLLNGTLAPGSRWLKDDR